MISTLWARFTNWVVRDFYTLEERALILQQAERLKLKTDLQRERVERRRRRAEDFRVVAVWRLPHMHEKLQVTSHFYLEESDLTRRLRAGPVVRRPDQSVLFETGQIDGFIRSISTYINFVLPWTQWTVDTDKLRGLKTIKVLVS